MRQSGDAWSALAEGLLGFPHKISGDMLGVWSAYRQKRDGVLFVNIEVGCWQSVVRIVYLIIVVLSRCGNGKEQHSSR